MQGQFNFILLSCLTFPVVSSSGWLVNKHNHSILFETGVGVTREGQIATSYGREQLQPNPLSYQGTV